MRLRSLLVIFLITQQGYSQQNLRLWFDQPANQWEESLPLGNGRIGAMPDGKVDRETVVLNDISLWSGAPQDADNPQAYQHLATIRQLLLEQKNHEAENLMYETFVSKGAGSGYGQGANVPYGSYQVLGHLRLDYELPVKPDGYQRELDIEDAIAHTSFEIDGVHYHREYLTSFSDDVIAIKLTADRPGLISFSLNLDRPERFETTTEKQDLVMRGQLNDGSGGPGMQYMASVRVIPQGGSLIARGSTLELNNANAALILISAGTDFKDPDFQQRIEGLLHKASKKDYAQIKKE